MSRCERPAITAGIEPRRVVMVGDSPSDMAAGRACGLRASLVRPQGRKMTGSIPNLPNLMPEALQIPTADDLPAPRSTHGDANLEP